MRPRTAATVLLITAVGAGAGPGSADTPTPAEARNRRIADLEQELDALRDETESLSGERNVYRGLPVVHQRVVHLRAKMERVDELIEEAGGTAEELAAHRQAVEDQPFITGEEAAGEVVKTTAESVAARRLLSTVGGRLLGAFGLVLTAGEYGGRWYVKQGDLGALDEALAQNEINLSGLYDLRLVLGDAFVEAAEAEERLEAIRARREEIAPELARLRETRRLLETPLDEAAHLEREMDHEGDAAEKRRRDREEAERGVRAADGEEPPRRRGVWPAGPPVQEPGRSLDPDRTRSTPRIPEVPAPEIPEAPTGGPPYGGRR